MLQHQHNLNRGAEAEAQFAPIAASARMIAEPVRMLGALGGPVGAAYGETKAQQIEQAGGARQGYSPLAIGGQVAIPTVASLAAKGLSRMRQAATTRPTLPVPQIGPVPNVNVTPIKQSVYLGPDRRRSPLDPAVIEESRRRAVQGGIERSERRRTVGEGATPSLADYHRYNRGETGTADFLENFDRMTRKPK